MRKPTLVLLLAALIPFATTQREAAPRTDYFFRFVGGATILDGQRLRGNSSIEFVSPSAVNPPFNPADHFRRISINASVPSTGAILSVVPTHPHPPPVPGYYGLSDQEGVQDAYRLISTYRLDDEGSGFKYTEWELRRAKGSGKVLLRYGGDGDGEWRWIARREKVYDGYMEKEIDK